MQKFVKTGTIEINVTDCIVKNTENCCRLCKGIPEYDDNKIGKSPSAWIYCQIFNKHCLEQDDFDETGEKDGCTYFSERITL